MFRKFLFVILGPFALLIAGCAGIMPPQTLPSSTTLEIQAATQQQAAQNSRAGASISSVSIRPPAYIRADKAEVELFKGKEPAVLFFHATWCPICRRMEEEITADIANFPPGTAILQVNYDTELELRKEFAIGQQATVVVLDAQGNVVFRAHDPDLEELKKQIVNSL